MGRIWADEFRKRRGNHEIHEKARKGTKGFVWVFVLFVVEVSRNRMFKVLSKAAISKGKKLKSPFSYPNYPPDPLHPRSKIPLHSQT
jgi:hypothetical protein